MAALAISGRFWAIVSPTFGVQAGLREIEYGVYGDLIIMSPKPYSVYLGDHTHIVLLQKPCPTPVPAVAPTLPI